MVITNQPVTVGYWISTRRNGRRLLLNYLFTYNVPAYSSTCIMGRDKSIDIVMSIVLYLFTQKYGQACAHNQHNIHVQLQHYSMYGLKTTTA